MMSGLHFSIKMGLCRLNQRYVLSISSGWRSVPHQQWFIKEVVGVIKRFFHSAAVVSLICSCRWSRWRQTVLLLLLFLVFLSALKLRSEQRDRETRWMDGGGERAAPPDSLELIRNPCSSLCISCSRLKTVKERHMHCCIQLEHVEKEQCGWCLTLCHFYPELLLCSVIGISHKANPTTHYW